MSSGSYIGETYMNIMGLLSGIVMLLVPTEEINVASKIYKATKIAGKVVAKNEQGTWNASIHEEGYAGVKQIILEIGGLK